MTAYPDPHGTPQGGLPPHHQQPAGPWNDLVPVHGAAPEWQQQPVQYEQPYAGAPAPAAPGTPVPPYGDPSFVQAVPAQQPQNYPVAGQPVAVAAVPVVAAPEVMPITPGATYLPPRAQTQDRSAMAAVLVFAVVAIGLWAGLGYIHAMAKVLASQDHTNTRIHAQLLRANHDLRGLDTKTQSVGVLATNSRALRGRMSGINNNMGEMLAGVDSIGEKMQQLNGALTTLDGEITTVYATNQAIGAKLETINGGLGTQARKVGQMRGDVQAASTQLGLVPPLLAATNARLTHVNGVVCYMGTKGIANDLKLKITFFGIPNGSSTIHATMIPPGGWGC